VRLQLGGGMMPQTVPHYLATTAVTLSFVNLAGEEPAHTPSTHPHEWPVFCHADLLWTHTLDRQIPSRTAWLAHGS
jgi:hypothetical protein